MPLPWLADRVERSGVPARLAFLDTPGKIGVVTPGGIGRTGMLNMEPPPNPAIPAGGGPEALRSMALAMFWAARVASAPCRMLCTSAAESGLWPRGSAAGLVPAEGCKDVPGGPMPSFIVILTLNRCPSGPVLSRVIVWIDCLAGLFRPSVGVEVLAEAALAPSSVAKFAVGV